jgi:hypothetical protein
LYIYTIRFYSDIKREIMKSFKKENTEITLFEEKWMELETILLNEMSQSQKNKYCRSSPVWNLD